jgi:hypothetical protein
MMMTTHAPDWDAFPDSQMLHRQGGYPSLVYSPHVVDYDAQGTTERLMTPLDLLEANVNAMVNGHDYLQAERQRLRNDVRWLRLLVIVLALINTLLLVGMAWVWMASQ